MAFQNLILDLDDPFIRVSLAPQKALSSDEPIQVLEPKLLRYIGSIPLATFGQKIPVEYGSVSGPIRIIYEKLIEEKFPDKLQHLLHLVKQYNSNFNNPRT